MIVWGGEQTNGYLDTGARYNPSTDSWVATSKGANTPSARVFHTAVWTGLKMIVWGGTGPRPSGGSTEWNNGGRYDPATNSWAATSTEGPVPTARSGHTAVWTGREMIVWGGSYQNTGGRYDPTADQWGATVNPDGTLVGRKYHTAVWTGTEMIVWGGQGSNTMALNTGGRYDPSTGTWVLTPGGSKNPAARYLHTAVWTGSEMIVWGGWPGLNTGGRFKPSTSTWAATSTVDAPTEREDSSAVWTGSEMIIWGGISGDALNTGGRYDPSTNLWAATSVGPNVPTPRYFHMAVQTGTAMLVWGGRPYESWGASYCACPGGRIFYRDVDGDGYGDPGVSIPSCTGAPPAGYVADSTDCNDGEPQVYPGASEVCDGVDNDCDGVADEGGNALCSDGNVCTDDVCTGVFGCDHAFNQNPCDDGLACTVDDVCNGAGACLGVAVGCNDGNACTLDACLEPSGTCNHDLPSGACSIVGRVVYYRDGSSRVEPGAEPVVGATIQRVSSIKPTVSAVTDVTGTYSFTNEAGNVTLTPLPLLSTDEDECRAVVTAADAALIANAAAFLVPLTNNQKIAADVSYNGTVSSYDAGLVARKTVATSCVSYALPVRSATGSDWAFVPISKAFTPLVGGENYDFLGVYYGDVTGNWTAPAGVSNVVADPGADETSPEETAEGPTSAGRTYPPPVGPGARLDIADGPRRSQDGSWTVVFGLENADGILGLDLELFYDAADVTIQSVTATGIASSLQLVKNDIDSATRIVLYGTKALRGSGAFLQARYTTTRPGTALPFRVAAQANEGQIPIVRAPGVPGTEHAPPSVAVER